MRSGYVPVKCGVVELWCCAVMSCDGLVWCC